MKIVKILTYPIKIIMFVPIYIYKFLISPLLPHTCRFTPSCSTYFLQAVEEFGPLNGFLLGVKRIARCRPNGSYGYDPVPTNLKGEAKWLF